jgi:hypothetical protein
MRRFGRGGDDDPTVGGGADKLLTKLLAAVAADHQRNQNGRQALRQALHASKRPMPQFLFPLCSPDLSYILRFLSPG